MKISPGMGEWREVRDLGISRESVCRNLHQWRVEEPWGLRTQLYVSQDRTTVPPETILKRLNVCDICPFFEGKIRAAAGSDNRWCDLLRFFSPFKTAFSEATFVVVKNFSNFSLWGGAEKNLNYRKRYGVYFRTSSPIQMPNHLPLAFFPFFYPAFPDIKNFWFLNSTANSLKACL